MLNSIALLGGTFDPIHIGHLRSALELRETFGFDEIRFVPCHQPPHRPAPGASSAQRLRMLQLALTDEANFRVDARELQRSGPSYTIDTLAELRAELGADCALSLVVGVDAFNGLDTWQRWRELLNFAHIVVMARPDYALPSSGAVAELLRAHRAEPAVLRQKKCGAIVAVQLTQWPVSATEIRARIRGGQSPRYLLPEAVWSFIREENLYRDQSIH